MVVVRIFNVFVFTGLLWGLAVDGRPCDSEELKCDDGSCIRKLQWCDSAIDCRDQSDEKYCKRGVPCKDIHFACANGKCIPKSGVCDNFNDCGDGSDEGNCHDSELYFLNDLVGDPIESGILLDSASTAAVKGFQSSLDSASTAAVKGIQYIMDKRDSDFSWGSFTPRAVIALSLASKYLPIAEKDLQLMKKQLNVRLTVDLMEIQKISLSSLAIYINALHATCQDPRNFQGIDLIARLRSEVDLAVVKNSSIPLAYLTLCISNDTMRYEDKLRLAKMYDKPEFHRIGARALIIMAMSCIYRTDRSISFSNYIENFLNLSAEAHVADIYARALFMQASLIIGYPVHVDEIISKQESDGSFGDLLATYYTIPVLLNSSLLDLKCPKNKGAKLERMMAKVNGKKEVTYSLWTASGKELNSHSMTIKFDGYESFFDIMVMAAARDPLYKFLYEETTDGKKVYSLAGIPNDVEGGRSWFLYSGNINTVKMNSLQDLEKRILGVDKIFPEDKEHFVFWLKRNSEAH